MQRKQIDKILVAGQVSIAVLRQSLLFTLQGASHVYEVYASKVWKRRCV